MGRTETPRKGENWVFREGNASHPKFFHLFFLGGFSKTSPHGDELRGFSDGCYRGVVKIEVNGEAREVADGTTVRELLVTLGLGETLVAVERNEEIVRRADHAQTALKDGDRVEVVHFVGGG